MRRWKLHIILCLILGAITTVAVAWGCVLIWTVEPNRAGVRDHSSGNPAAELAVSTWDSRFEFQDEHLHTYTFTDRGWMRFVSEYGSTLPSSGGIAEYTLMNVLEAGWPLRGLRGDFRQPAGRSGRHHYAWRPPMVFGLDPSRIFDYLPLLPLWPGFVIDTLFYAAIWFGVFFGFVSARRFIRVRRGRCRRCGYDLRGELEQGCPECGWQREESAA